MRNKFYFMNRSASSSTFFINYLLLLGIGLIWGSQYFFIKIALGSFSNVMVMSGRVVIGASVLTLLLNIRKENVAPTQAQHSFLSLLPEFVLIGFFEATLPCFLIAWAQQQVPSSVTAILMGTVPLFATILEALFVKDYPISGKKIIAIITGFFGVLVLIGPGLLANQCSRSFATMFPIAPVIALLSASLCFAISVSLIKIRLGNRVAPLRSAQGILIGATMTALPFLFFFSKTWVIHPISHFSCLSLVLLGIFAGGIVYIFYVNLINRAGPSFASSANYLALPIGAFLGIIIAKEPFTPNVIASFVFILSALWLLKEKKKA